MFGVREARTRGKKSESAGRRPDILSHVVRHTSDQTYVQHLGALHRARCFRAELGVKAECQGWNVTMHCIFCHLRLSLQSV